MYSVVRIRISVSSPESAQAGTRGSESQYPNLTPGICRSVLCRTRNPPNPAELCFTQTFIRSPGRAVACSRAGVRCYAYAMLSMPMLTACLTDWHETPRFKDQPHKSACSSSYSTPICLSNFRSPPSPRDIPRSRHRRTPPRPNPLPINKQWLCRPFHIPRIIDTRSRQISCPPPRFKLSPLLLVKRECLLQPPKGTLLLLDCPRTTRGSSSDARATALL